LTLNGGASLNNYFSPTYVAGTLTISKKQPSSLRLPTNGIPGTALTISLLGKSGNGSETITVTSGGCTLAGFNLSRATAGTCGIQVVIGESANYLTETATATVSFFLFTFSQPTNNVGGGGEIGVNGANKVSTNASAAPVITSYVNSTLGSGTSAASGQTLTFTGKNFIASSTVSFPGPADADGNPTEIVVPASTVNTSNAAANTLTVTVPAGATSGRIGVSNNVGTRAASVRFVSI
jgi:hypothetical protein